MKGALTLMALIIVSCKSTGTGSQQRLADEDPRLTLLIQDGYLRVETPEVAVFSSQKELQAFFAKVNRTRKPGIPVPIVDFSKESVLIACLGEKAGVPKMQVTHETATELVVGVKQVDQKEDKIPFPFCVYKIPTTGKQLELLIMD
ncbi:MAG: hypothetical protein AAGF77_09910 [Bacteroidota bacterium]